MDAFKEFCVVVSANVATELPQTLTELRMRQGLMRMSPSKLILPVLDSIVPRHGYLPS